MMSRLVQGMSTDFERVVVSLTDRGVLAEGLEASGVQIHTLGMRGVASLPKAVRQLVELIRFYCPDVVSTWMYHSDLIGGVAARIAGVSSVAWNIRNSDLSPEHSSRLTRLIVRLNARLSGRVPRTIICCSETARRIHVELGFDPRRFVVIPNGFDLRDFAPDPAASGSVRAELSIPAAAPLIGLIARWHPQKNHRGFVEAAAELRRRVPDAHFLLAGYQVTPDNPDLNGWIESAGLGPAVRLLGLRSDIPRLTAALDVASSSSTFGEAFPNVLGEAMACGVPCVATDVGDSAYVIGDTGFIVPPGDPRAMAAGWERLLSMSREERFALSDRVRERVARNFDIVAVRERYEQVFRSLALPR